MRWPCISPRDSPSLNAYAADVRSIVDFSGKMIGRATLVDRSIDKALEGSDDRIAASKFRPPVTVTAGGFRSDEHWNFCGLLLGKPTVASRSRSQPVLMTDPVLLSDWATEQAQIVHKRSPEPNVQFNYARLIRALGGDPGPLLCFRFRDVRISADTLSSMTDLPSQIELKQDGWGLFNGPNWNLSDCQLGVSCDKMFPRIDVRLEVDTMKRSQHPFWEHYWQTLWALAIEAIAKAWGVPLDDVLTNSDLSYESLIIVKGPGNTRTVRLTSDIIRRPK